MGHQHGRRGSCRRNLDRAALLMKKTRFKLLEGYVKFTASKSIASHPSHGYKTRQLCKRRERKGAVAYRRALREMTDEHERRLLRAANSSALSAVRRATTNKELTVAERARHGARPKKTRPWRDVTAPDIVRARRHYFGMKRRVFEKCNRVGHSMITKDADGNAVTWIYVSGSGLSGVRLYERETGVVKRLACHSRKQRKSGVVDTQLQGSSSSAPADEDCWIRDGPQDPTVRPLNLSELTILKSSPLENEDGTGSATIVAVEFDIVDAMAASIASRTKRCTAGDILNGRAAWSLGSDGGPFQRTPVTLFTWTLSADWLVAGRTAMVPVLYTFSGEQHVH